MPSDKRDQASTSPIKMSPTPNFCSSSELLTQNGDAQGSPSKSTTILTMAQQANAGESNIVQTRATNNNHLEEKVSTDLEFIVP